MESCGIFAKVWEQSEAGWWFLAKFVSIVKLQAKQRPRRVSG